MTEENNKEELNSIEEIVDAAHPVDAEEILAEESVEVEEETSTEETTEAPGDKKHGPRGRGNNRDRGPGGKKKSSRRKSRQEEEVSEYIEKVVQVRRVTKVVKGGKKLSFRTTVIIGNEKGKVGVGVGKASEVLIAIKKAISDARKNLVDIETVANTNTISHAVIGKSGGARVLLKPAAEGTGIIAGGTARIVLELAGVGDILSKSLGSKSPLNVARATVNALGSLRKFQEVASSRGSSVKKILFA